jgi:spore maturation protein CgeB
MWSLYSQTVYINSKRVYTYNFQLESSFGAPRARALYCPVDPDVYAPAEMPERWHLGYLGTYSADRQPALERRLLEPARRWSAGRFIVAGAQFPDDYAWPGNVEHVIHLSPPLHREFYCGQRFTLNVTRAAMVQAGHSPSVRLFEAAACATPVISDTWTGLEEFFDPGQEIIVTHSADETLEYLRWTPEPVRKSVGARARKRVLAAHTSDHRARELEEYCGEVVRA